MKKVPILSLLTAGRDKPFALGIAKALIDQGVAFEFLGSDLIDSPFLHNSDLVSFINIRGDQSEDAPFREKVIRIIRYYKRLIVYAFRSESKLFHILWNNKFEYFDRTFLMLLYKLTGHKIAFTAHNVNIRKRDGGDNLINRCTLRIQYHLCDHVFVHTSKMKQELLNDFKVSEEKISVYNFPLNDTVPNTKLDYLQARKRLGLKKKEKVILFFGRIAPYKGLEYLVEALSLVGDSEIKLLIAGGLKGSDIYYEKVRSLIRSLKLEKQIIERIEFIPDEDTEIYFKAADVQILPYTHIFQSGVLFLGYNFGIPVIATDVGTFRDDIVENLTGFICESHSSKSLAETIERFFQSKIFLDGPEGRKRVQEYAVDNYSWSTAMKCILPVYQNITKDSRLDGRSLIHNSDASCNKITDNSSFK